MKPIFRWTLGPTLSQGREILIESVKRTTKALGIDRFNWIICYNQLSKEIVDELKIAIKDYPVEFYEQQWRDCPIQDEEKWHNPRREDGSFNFHGNSIGGSLWKVVNSRMQLDTHEIIMDNDLVILKQIPAIEEFLSQNDKVLMLEEPILFYGRYAKFLKSKPPYFNSGLMGLPPGYDFGKEIKRIWEWHGKLQNLTQADEQGLLGLVMQQKPSIGIKKEIVVEILGRDFSAKINGDEYAIHFVQSNRMPNHRGWKSYGEKLKNV